LRLSSGKRKRLEAVSDSRGVIAALAIDQRDALRSLFSAELKIEKSSVPHEQLEKFKSIVVRVLSPHASAVLLEPEYGLRAAVQRAPSSGLLMAYEVSGYDPQVPSRLPRLLEHWSVRRFGRRRRARHQGSAVLCLVPMHEKYRSASGVWVERIGSECAGCDVPFFLEIVPYQDGMDDKSPQFARCKPDILTSAMQEFSQPRYCVDVLKVGVPVTMAYVEGSSASAGTFVHTRAEALQLYRQAAAAAAKPFLFLSAG